MNWYNLLQFKTLGCFEDRRFKDMLKTRNQKKKAKSAMDNANREQYYIIDRFISDVKFCELLKNQFHNLKNN